MPRVDGYWVRKEKVRLYSGVALGAVVFRGYDGQTNKSIFPAGHLNVIGFRFGKELGYFVDFGYGFNGLLNTGVNVRF